MKKNIAFIYSRYYPLGGGVSNAAKNFAEALVKDGNKVTMYTLISYRSKLQQSETINNVEIRRFRIPVVIFNFLSMRNTTLNKKLMAYWVGLKILIEKRKHDLILGHNIQWGGIFASIIGKMNKIPSASMAHGEDVNQLKGRKRKELETIYALKNLNYVFSINTDFTNTLKEYFFRTIYSLPNLYNEATKGNMDVKLIERRYNHGKLKLLCIGRLDVFGKNKIEIKGYSTVLKAMTLLPNHITLDIVGEGSLYEEYEKYISNKKLTSRIKLLGALPFDQVQQKLNLCSIVVMPSNIEGLSMVMLEAMSKGIPLLASNIAGAKDYIKNNINGFLIEPEDSKNLISHIKNIENDFDLYKKVSLESKKTYLENFTEKSVINTFYKHLKW